MIDLEPDITVALRQGVSRADWTLQGRYLLSDGRHLEGPLSARVTGDGVALFDPAGNTIVCGHDVSMTPVDPERNFFAVSDVRIGIGFHWQQSQTQSFRGTLKLFLRQDASFDVLNVIPLEQYLASVISSEMAATAPGEFLKVQAVTARSWLTAMLAKKKAPRALPASSETEIVHWQDVNDHHGFDVCADDHCQRYQGITRIIPDTVEDAMRATCGLFLVDNDTVCDARYYKCCGGLTDVFSTAWEDIHPPYLQSVSCFDQPYPQVATEAKADAWLLSHPKAYCHTTDHDLLGRILPSFDQSTANFFRWKVEYEPGELARIIQKKSGIDFGEIRHLKPLTRGPSGRISRLEIEGSKHRIIVGKELEIRRWLAPTHLLSSAFVVTPQFSPDQTVRRFTLHGGGWGHGVGLCQIGAAVMAGKGWNAGAILAHFFPGTQIQKRY